MHQGREPCDGKIKTAVWFPLCNPLVGTCVNYLVALRLTVLFLIIHLVSSDRALPITMRRRFGKLGRASWIAERDMMGCMRCDERVTRRVSFTWSWTL